MTVADAVHEPSIEHPVQLGAASSVAGCAVDVDELDHQVTDPIILKSPLEIGKLGIDSRHALVHPPLAGGSAAGV